MLPGKVDNDSEMLIVELSPPDPRPAPPPRGVRPSGLGIPHPRGVARFHHHPLVITPQLHAALVAAFILTVCPANAERPNILIVLTDDHRWDALGCKGHPFLQTPNIDRIASEGVDFQNAFVTTSLCSPSRASILTGLYAHNHGVVDNYHAVRDDLTFFPELLQDGGYETAFIGKWHMGDTDEKQRGFDHWVSFEGQGVYAHAEGTLKVEGRYVPQANRTGLNVDGARVPQTKYITDELTDYASAWLATRGERPFFLYLSHKAVHADFLPPDRFAYHYDDQAFTPPPTPLGAPELFTDVPRWVRDQFNSRHGAGFAYYTELDLARYYRRYCETLLAVDESVGKILDQLEEAGELGNTLVVYLGDNGFLFGEHGLIDKRCAYEESMRIPLLARWPEGMPHGAKVSEMVANIDVAPTLLDAAGIPAPANVDGRSFLALARGEKTGWRDALLYEYYWERNYPQTPTTHALREERYKYIRYHGIWDTDELYDLETDPHERHNLIHDPAHGGRVLDMNARLFELLAASRGLQIPLLEDRGTKFLHRRQGGPGASPFPDWFYRPPGTDGR